MSLTRVLCFDRHICLARRPLRFLTHWRKVSGPLTPYFTPECALRLNSASGCCRLAPRPRCLPPSSFRAFEIPTYAIVLRIVLFASLFPRQVASMPSFLPRVEPCALVSFYASGISCILCSILSRAKPRALHNTFSHLYCTNSVCFCLASGVPGWAWAYIS